MAVKPSRPATGAEMAEMARNAVTGITRGMSEAFEDAIMLIDQGRIDEARTLLVERYRLLNGGNDPSGVQH